MIDWEHPGGNMWKFKSEKYLLLSPSKNMVNKKTKTQIMVNILSDALHKRVIFIWKWFRNERNKIRSHMVESTNQYMMLKKGQLTESFKKTVFASCGESFFKTHAGPKRGCSTYLIKIRNIWHTSDVFFLIIFIRCGKHSLFGQALDQKLNITPRDVNCFKKISWSFF